MEVELAEVVLGNHGEADGLLLLLLLARDLQLGGVEVHKVGLDILVLWSLLLLLRLDLLLRRSDDLLRLLLGLLLLSPRHAKDRRVFADVVDEWCECWVA